MTALVRSGYVTEAFASISRWVARCQRRYCPRSVQLQRFAPHFECDFCGAVTEVLWPPPAMVEGIERLLMMRPVPSTRNWLPGETLHNLMFENAAHGVFDDAPEMKPGAVKFSVVDHNGNGWIQVDNLPALQRQKRTAITP